MNSFKSGLYKESLADIVCKWYRNADLLTKKRLDFLVEQGYDIISNLKNKPGDRGELNT